MFDPKKNDMIDTVFNRYKDSFKLAENTDKIVPVKDRDYFYTCLRRHMRKDFKQVDRDYRREKRREWWSRRWWVKLWRKIFGKCNPVEEPAALVPDTEPPVEELAALVPDIELLVEEPAAPEYEPAIDWDLL